MLPGCGFVRAVLAAVLHGHLENVTVHPSFNVYLETLGCGVGVGSLADP